MYVLYIYIVVTMYYDSRGITMIKKLAKYGNSLAVLIDKPILELLDITEKTQLRITTDGDRIIIEPLRVIAHNQISDNAKIQEAYELMTEQYNEALKKLAKN